MKGQRCIEILCVLFLLLFFPSLAQQVFLFSFPLVTLFRTQFERTTITSWAPVWILLFSFLQEAIAFPHRTSVEAQYSLPVLLMIGWYGALFLCRRISCGPSVCAFFILLSLSLSYALFLEIMSEISISLFSSSIYICRSVVLSCLLYGGCQLAILIMLFVYRAARGIRVGSALS